MAAPDDRPWRIRPGGLVVNVRAMPKGGRDAIDGIVKLADGVPVLKARVKAAPADGAANAALARLLAHAAGIAPSAVTLLQGAAGRIKTFRLNGDAAALAAALERAAAESGAKRK
jgi:uncharacterized protein YggU (UPF0235/DUF167 family)